MQGSFKTSDDCSIEFTLHAADEPGEDRIVLIHSLGLDASIWNGTLPKLMDHAAVLTYDCRGHGKSGRAPGPYTPELFARDLAELLDYLEWETALVAGCSMGGCVTQAFAGLYPSRVSAAGLIDTTAWYGEDGPAAWRERAAVARAKGFAAMVDFQAARWFGDKFRREHPELVKAAAAVFVATDLDCFAASCGLLGDSDLRPYLPNLRMPVAVIVGEEDYATPVEDSRRLHEAIPGSTLTILPGARHLTPMEAPEAVASELIALMRRAESHEAGVRGETA